MMVEGIILYACITIVSLVLLVISLLSYWKYRKLRHLLISVMLLLFFLQGILLSLGLFFEEIACFTSSIYIWVFTLIILVLLYITILKK